MCLYLYVFLFFVFAYVYVYLHVFVFEKVMVKERTQMTQYNFYGLPLR